MEIDRATKVLIPEKIICISHSAKEIRINAQPWEKITFKLQNKRLFSGGKQVRVKLTTYVEGDPKAPVSIATTLRCWEGCYSFPCIAPLYPWYVPYSAEC